MKKKDLLELIDRELLESLYGFCYARCADSYEAQELCSDITFALVKAANGEGELENPHAFIWRTAKNVYADFSQRRKRSSERSYMGDPDEAMANVADKVYEEDTDDEDMKNILHCIAYLTRAYREVMIAYYLDGMSVETIAKMQNTSETAIRQRLFSARKTIKNEVMNMENNISKPTALQRIDYTIIGTGAPGWGDPREVLRGQFSNHILCLCSKKPMSAKEISDELGVPMMYVEEECEILANGKNGEYGTLRRMPNGKYAINFVLFDDKQIESAWNIYERRIPMICDTVARFIEEHREEYFAYPYINRKVTMNLILWQNISVIADAISSTVRDKLTKTYFADIKRSDRPFSIFGHLYTGKHFGCGWDGIDGSNICGYSHIHLANIYIPRCNVHFHCGENIANNAKIQLAIRAINGIGVDTLTEYDREQAAKAIEEGYLYREGDTLYTKILVSKGEDYDRLFAVTDKLSEEFAGEAETIASELAAFIRENVPEYLLGDWRHAVTLANLPVLDTLVEALIERGIMTPPEGGLDAEGVWMIVEK